MATFYVSSGSGDDSDNGESPATAKKTLGSALGLGMSDGDTVEILDEETYPEYNITIDIPNLTITHTASHLGRPKVNALGQTRMWIHDTYGTTFHNIEMYNATTLLRRGTARGGEFHMTGCYAHGMSFMLDNYISGSPDNQTSIDSCVLYFINGSLPAAIATASDCVIKNSLVTGSADKSLFGPGWPNTTTCTASFCTFIRRGASTAPIIQAAKVIDCIVSGTGDGIASDNHTYNLAIAENANFRNAANSGDGSAGTGDLEDQDPLFVNGAIIGTGTGVKSYFQLQAKSPAINYGTPYLLTTRDLTGSVRPTGGGAPGHSGNPDMGCFEYVYTWGAYGTETHPRFGPTFVINSYLNLSSNYKLGITQQSPITGGVEQVPFFLGSRGPVSLRKDKAYIATVSDPSQITGSS